MLTEEATELYGVSTSYVSRRHSSRSCFGLLSSERPLNRCSKFLTNISSFASLIFKDKATEDIFDDEDSKDVRKRCFVNLWTVARRKLDQLNAATSREDMRILPGNRLEALKGERKGQYSVRINDQYRICFTWTSKGAVEVEIVDYH